MGLLGGLALIGAAFIGDIHQEYKWAKQAAQNPISPKVRDTLWQIQRDYHDDQGTYLIEIIQKSKCGINKAVKILGKRQCERNGIPWDAHTAEVFFPGWS